ncbi:hypothetical protein ACOKM5_23320 [Streptomyces sp. BH097]|uniref:hypothetical protein n=1 Tax=unclassified Streptomyces TaxID=2593676 RepID=UPI003BB7F35F
MSATCGLCETDLEHGYLCPGCTLATAHRLDDAPRWYTALAGFLQPAVTGPAEGVRNGGRTEAPLPVAEAPFSLRGPGGIVGILEDWRSAMQADREWGAPVIAGDTERRVLVAARALSINLEWISGCWPMAGAMAEEIRDLERGVRSIVEPTDPAERPIRMGLCPTVVDAEDTRCGAVLTRRPGEGTVTCRWCGSTWPPSRALALARAQQDAANSLGTLAS